MKLKIEIQMDNAAFEPDNGTEAARILRELAARLEGENLQPADLRILRDFNGNRTGKAKVTK